MSTCCKTANLLRRDGTSQPQRFPLALGEGYVKIDERSPADILNFIHALAQEFNYYGGDHLVDGDWVEFFGEDVSFVLAQTLMADMAAYRAHFSTLLAQAEQELDANGAVASTFDCLEQTFQSFLLLPPAQALEPLPALVSRWISLLPDAGLYTGSTVFSFKDLLLDGRQRLLPVARKLQVAHEESATHATSGDASHWTDLESIGWELSSISDAGGYLSTSPEVAEVERVLELLRAGFDTFAVTLERFQVQIPTYLLQSLEKFPWHNPQNALFLAFMRIFGHAQDHINSLKGKHLLYEYMDVLRFAKRALTPDQAVVIVQLRKGIDRYRLTAGTRMKAGKDVDGKPMTYAVDQETVVNLALIHALKNVYVERATENGPILGVYASPIANSADGLGAVLPGNDPKWNLFGEAQLAKLPDDRTMPDARLGFAIASPLFLMKEGERTIDATFMVDVNLLPTLPSRDHSPWERLALNMRVAFTAEYTAPKGWARARIMAVQIIDNPTKIQQYRLEPAVVDVNVVAVNIKVVLDEGDPPCVVYSEKVHQEGLGTPWPVLKLSLQGQSDDYSSLPIPLTAFDSTVGVPGESFTLFEGNVYYNPTPVILPSFSNPSGNPGTQYAVGALTLLEDFDAFWTLYPSAGPYGEVTDYAVGDYVVFNGGIYQATEAITQSTVDGRNQNPDAYPQRWARAFRTHLYESLYRWYPEQLFLKVGVKGAYGLLYENDFGKLKGEKPFPPFGGSPVIGSRMYIGSQEIFGKHLDELTIEIVWQDPPDHLGRHYVKYEGVVTALSTGTTDHVCGADCICCVPVSYEAEAPNETMSNLRQGPGEAEAAESPWGLPDVEMIDAQLEQYQACYAVCPTHTLLGNSAWKADIHFLYDGLWEYLDRQPLFYQDANGNGARQRHTLYFPAVKFAAFERDLNLGEHSRLESNTPRGFIRLELATPVIAFGHKYYRDLYVDAVQAAIANRPYPLTSVDAPNEPYTPIIKEIRLHYVSKASMDFRAGNAFEENYQRRVDQYFHLHPFGHTEEHAHLRGGSNVPMLPQYTEEGSLFIGIEGLSTPSTLSVLYQLAEGSGDSDIEIIPPVWSVLRDNRWTHLQRRDMLLDTTDDLITSGVIQYGFDGAFQAGSTLLDRNLHWLRVMVTRRTPAYMKAIDIIAQAVLVSFQDQGNNPAHLAKALPAETIVALQESAPSVKKISQPYGSQGGKLPEEGNTFLTRVSERLRHKQRSINVWDYERMVLEEFPSIYKVKCLNHTEFKAPHTMQKDWEISPGHVTVVCIPDLRNLNAVNPFEPKASIRTIRQVEKFLLRHVSSWVHLKVKNPLYEVIRVNCLVGFIPGKDPGFYTRQLESDLQRFLSPWAFDHEREIVFGGKIHHSQIIHFLEQQDYVDFIVKFSMDHIVDGNVRADVLEAVATTGRSILVSALTHAITSVKPDCALCIPGDPPEVDTGCCTHQDQ